MNEPRGKEIVWDAPEYDHVHKGAGWYWMSIIVAVLFLGMAMWQRNFLFGLFIVIAEILFMVWGEKPPRTIRFAINEHGFEIDSRKHYRWSDLKDFSVDTEHHKDDKWADIYLKLKTHIRPPLRLKISTHDLTRVRSAFAERLPEVEFEASFTDALERWTGF